MDKRCIDCKNYFEDRSVGETNCESFDISENDFNKYFFENDITNCPYYGDDKEGF